MLLRSTMSDRRSWLLSMLTTGLVGCAPPRGPSRAPTPRGPLLWPAPPEQPRFIYEAALRSEASLRVDTAPTSMQRRLTGEDNKRASFGKPLAVAAARGRVYVTDTEDRRVFVFDVPRRRTFSFGLRLEGELRKPGGIDIDGQGLVYVVDSTARRVVVFDELGLFVRQIDGAGQWTRPTGIAVTPQGDRIHVVDTGGVENTNHRVWIHDALGRSLGSIGTRGNMAGQFNLPTDAAVGPDGNLWVLDAGNFRVQAFDAAGTFLRMFGSVGNAVGQFARPRGLAVDREGLIYVSDATFCNVQVFQADGQLMLTIGSRAESDGPGRYRLPAKLACDESGRLYVVDQFLHKVEVLRRLSDTEGRRLQAVPPA